MSENRGPVALAAVIVISAISSTFAAARLITRWKKMGRIMLDDWLILAAVIFGWTNVATFGVAVSHGYGQHSDALTPEQRMNALMWSIIGFTPGLLSLSLPKPAVVVLLTRALNPGKLQKRFLWFIGILCVTNLVPYIVFYYVQCQPIRFQWDNMAQGKCVSKSILIKYAMYSSAFCAFSDIYLSAYPAFVLYGLQMSFRKKLALSLALGFGSLSIIAVIYKMTRLPLIASDDTTYDTVELVILTILEGSIIIIAACVPVLQPLVEFLFGKRFFYGSRRYPYQNSGSEHAAHVKPSKGTFGSSFGRQTRDSRQGHGMSKGSISFTQTTIGARGSQERIWEKQDPDGKIVRIDTFSVTVESSDCGRSNSNSSPSSPNLK